FDRVVTGRALGVFPTDGERSGRVRVDLDEREGIGRAVERRDLAVDRLAVDLHDHRRWDRAAAGTSDAVRPVDDGRMRCELGTLGCPAGVTGTAGVRTRVVHRERDERGGEGELHDSFAAMAWNRGSSRKKSKSGSFSTQLRLPMPSSNVFASHSSACSFMCRPAYVHAVLYQTLGSSGAEAVARTIHASARSRSTSPSWTISAAPSASARASSGHSAS